MTRARLARTHRPLGRALVAWLAIAMLGCAGALEDPDRFLQSRDSGRDDPDGGAVVDAAVDDGGEDVEAEARAIVMASCGGCHSAALHLGGLDLMSAGVGERLRTGTAMCDSVVGQPLVDSTDAASSYFIAKLGDTPPCGVQMPQGGAPLSPADIDVLTRWLETL